MQIEGFLCIEIESRKAIQEIVFSEPVLTFQHVYGSECLNFGHFPPSQPEMQMEHAFKAKKVTFREGNYGKVEKVDFHVFLRREKAFKIRPGFLWKIRKTLTLGDSYAIRDFPASFSAPDCTKRIYIAFRGRFSDTELKKFS